MTAEQFQDALTLLPADLVTATDRLRRAPRGLRRPWRRILPLAACLAVVLCAALALSYPAALGGVRSADTTAQAPAAMAPLEAAVEEQAASDSLAEAEEQGESHLHRFAQDESAQSVGGCGNAQAVLYWQGEAYALAGSDALTLAGILDHLAYDPGQVCRCQAEFTVDTELLTGVAVNLTQGFARCEAGQASLTQAQADILQALLQRLTQGAQ